MSIEELAERLRCVDAAAVVEVETTLRLLGKVSDGFTVEQRRLVGECILTALAACNDNDTIRKLLEAIVEFDVDERVQREGGEMTRRRIIDVYEKSKGFGCDDVRLEATFERNMRDVDSLLALVAEGNNNNSRGDVHVYVD